MLKDSGKRENYDTGCVRENAPGKGRCDLMPLRIVAKILRDDVLLHIDHFMYNGNTDELYAAIDIAIENLWGGDAATAMLEMAKQYELGVEKYSVRNWEKGMPLHRYIDSGVRHYLKCLRGDDDEPHKNAFFWNIVCAIWTVDNIDGKLIDLPFAVPEMNFIKQ